MQRTGRAARGGFTLIELIMVIAILSIISTLAVSRIGSVRDKAARKVSVANQQAVGRAVETFLALNDGGKLNRLDALVDAGTAATGAAGYDFSARGAAGTVGGLYRGPDDDTSEAVRERNSGLYDAGGSSLVDLLCLYRVSLAEAEALHRLGLKYAMQHDTYALGAAYDRYGKGDDGTVPQAADGLDAALSACVAKFVTNGMAFAAVDGTTEAGRAVFRSCGQELLPTATGSTGYDENSVKAEIAATGGPLLALGLGQEASIVGAAKGGIDSAPYSEALPAKYYRQYILLFRLRTAGAAVTAEFAGVLDPMGNTIRAARHLLRD